jgi:hypothetical protein
MNTYKKYCPNVFLAQCEEEYQKGDTIIVETKYGKENEHIVHNLVGKRDGYFLYSITRKDGFNNQERAKNKVDKLNSWADSADKKSDNAYKASNKDRDFLSLGEPIKVGHHSEKRHRKAIEQAQNNMSKSVEHADKAEQYRQRTAYWESMANKIDLSMPESLGFFKAQLDEATEYHKGLKDGSIKREHSFSLTYAKKKCNELKDKHDTALILWA